MNQSKSPINNKEGSPQSSVKKIGQLTKKDLTIKPTTEILLDFDTNSDLNSVDFKSKRKPVLRKPSFRNKNHTSM